MTTAAWALMLWVGGTSAHGVSTGPHLQSVFATHAACLEARRLEIDNMVRFGSSVTGKGFVVERGAGHVVLEWSPFPDPGSPLLWESGRPLRRSQKVREVRLWECREIP